MNDAEGYATLKRNGLTSSQVEESRRRFGENKLPEKRSRSRLNIYFSQFKAPLIYIISAAAIISLILDEYSDAAIARAGNRLRKASKH